MTLTQGYLCVRNVRNADGKRVELVAKREDGEKDWTVVSIGDPSDRVWGKDTKVIDGQGGVIAPAFVDLCSFPDRARTTGGLKEESAIAARGGFSAVAELDPPTTQTGKEAFVRRVGSAHCRLLAIEEIPADLTQIRQAKERGVIALSDAFVPIAEPSRLWNVMQEAAANDMLLILSPLCHGWQGVLHEGRVAGYFKVDPATDAAEEIAVSRILILAKKSGCRVHIPIVSTKGALALVREAKRQGACISCGVSPFHFALDEDSVFLSGTSAKILPALADRASADALVEGIADGTIDCISSLHTPCRLWEKQKPMDSAAFGASGYLTAFSASMTRLVHGGVISFSRLIELMSIAPARIVSHSAELRAGGVADFVILNPTRQYVVGEESANLCGITPFAGRGMTGCVANSFILGQWY